MVVLLGVDAVVLGVVDDGLGVALGAGVVVAGVLGRVRRTSRLGLLRKTDQIQRRAGSRDRTQQPGAV
ncbi:hypothetical protein, partial [Mycolicibacterium insubricum]|uniref:hypothetical protein n=1 Tax=Mycolicibacterium insubricum TaxID=444597 RepID=UPI0024B3448C